MGAFKFLPSVLFFEKMIIELTFYKDIFYQFGIVFENNEIQSLMPDMVAWYEKGYI